MTLAIVFPGQGSQSVGMLNGLHAAMPALVDSTFAEASDALGQDLWQIVARGPEEKLNQTEITQPAMLAADIALWRAWQEKAGPTPSVVAGHSLGEYSALVCAGALEFNDAIKIVAQRGRFMQEAVPAGTGAMAAVLGLADDDVIAACKEAAQGEVVEAVNFNAPGQVVIAGNKAAVERAAAAAKARGAKRAMLLPVSVPSHCALMRPAADRLAQLLSATKISAPRITVLHNVDVQHHDSGSAIAEALVRQLYSPVRWVETIRALPARGVTKVIECGPGKVLAGLIKRIDSELPVVAVTDAETLQAALA